MLTFSWDEAVTRMFGLPTSGAFDAFPWTAIIAIAVVGAWALWVTAAVADRKGQR